MRGRISTVIDLRRVEKEPEDKTKPGEATETESVGIERARDAQAAR